MDESGIDQALCRLFGRSIRGFQVNGEISGKRFHRTSFIAGKRGKEIIAAMIYEGTCDTLLFETWLKKRLIPTLVPGQTVILDNARFHKSKKAKEMIEAAGCTLIFLPPYSPDLNPIEKFWSWLKKQIKEFVSSCKTLQEAVIKAFKSYEFFV